MTVYSTYYYKSEGYGDFIRSLLAVFVYCKENNIEHKLYIPDHPLNKCLECLTEKLDYPNKTFVIIGECDTKPIVDELNRCKNPNYNVIIYSNIYTFVSLELLKKYVGEFREFLKLSDAVKQRIVALKNQINNVDYTAIQIRCGDKFMECHAFSGNDNRVDPHQDILYRKLAKTIDYLKINYTSPSAPNGLPTCIFTDVKSLRDRVCGQYGLLCFDTEIHHMGSKSDNDNVFIDTVAEFELLGEAKTVIIFSPTGFAYWSAFIHDVPLFICDDLTHKIVPFERL